MSLGDVVAPGQPVFKVASMIFFGWDADLGEEVALGIGELGGLAEGADGPVKVPRMSRPSSPVPFSRWRQWRSRRC
jgi:hypothetical protein